MRINDAKRREAGEALVEIGRTFPSAVRRSPGWQFTALPKAPLDYGPRGLETPLRVGVPVMTSTLAFSLIAAFLMAGVIADSFWGRRFRR
jgi:hypothetical protein